MKITAFDDLFPSRAAVGGSVAVYASGSNNALGDTAGGGDVVGDPGDYTVVGLRRTVSLASNIGGGTVGDVMTIISTSPRLAMFATPSNTGGASFGSNATRVSETSYVGALTTAAREDHRHDGIGSITASSSNTLQRGTFNLRAGNNVSIGYTDSDGDGELDTATIHAAAASGGGGGGVDPWIIEILPWFAHGNTNWDTLNPAAGTSSQYPVDIYSTGAQNAERWWYVGMSGGTWDISLLHTGASNQGIYSVRIDDVEVGTIDGYVSSNNYRRRATVTNVSITAGMRKLSLKMTSKNASSSNYYGEIAGIQLRRTA